LYPSSSEDFFTFDDANNASRLAFILRSIDDAVYASSAASSVSSFAVVQSCFPCVIKFWKYLSNLLHSVFSSSSFAFALLYACTL
jgi:hypothetical protein